MDESAAANPLHEFHPVVRAWFEETFGAPSPPQQLGWPPVIRGEHTLLLAPTGSGKTLAAFLWAINHLFERHLRNDPVDGVGILYISPLKALNNDVKRNLRVPLEGIQERSSLKELNVRPIRTAVRTGDTPQADRTRMVKQPPEILITTPESLYLMLTARRSRAMFSTVQYVIVDEIHALCGNKRGVHLSLSLERLQEIASQEFVRIGLSATQRPLEEIARFLGGQKNTPGGFVPRPVTVIDAGRKKEMDLRVISPVPDFTSLPEDSVWPSLHAHLLELIRSHQTTLVFVNNRRLAERTAARLNDLITGNEQVIGLSHVPQGPGRRREPGNGDEQPVRAYHGSMSREAREEMETALKAGELKALITTSALELGIDIGSIDLVVQIQSPRGVARGLQRVGRSGHLITSSSKGRILPSFREDLVESAVAARAMNEHNVEETRIPTNCLDVLSQQIVAMVSVEEQDVESLFDFVRRSYCFAGLPRPLFDGVVSMLSGKYSRGAMRELRPRISWDKRNNLLRPLPGTAHLAIGGSGTIADRGYFGVYLENAETRIGEIDEEFVFESRTGDTFILGTDTWRISDIAHDRIRVVPAPGEPARMPFWRGEGLGRTFELSRLVGAFRREMASRSDDPSCLHWLRNDYPIDRESAWNILEYFRDQLQVAGYIPHDRLLLSESFRDELGDPRLVIHSCYGRRVNGLFGLFLARRLKNSTGVEPQMLYNDDGILLRSADNEDFPEDILEDISVEGGVAPILEDLPRSALFGGQFRQNAVRSLLMSRGSPGKRAPLWLQRLKAKDLLEVVREYDDFPVVIETVREVLNEVLDLERYKEILRDIERGTIEVRHVRTEIPSPFTSSLMLEFVSTYLYEWDKPKAESSQTLPVDHGSLHNIVDLGSSEHLFHPVAAQTVESQLQHLADGYRARSPEELHELLLRLGDLSPEEIALRCDGGDSGYVDTLLGDGRAVRVTIARQPRIVAAEQEGIYADGGRENLPHLIRTLLQSRGTVDAALVSARYGVAEHVAAQALHSLEEEEDDVTRVRTALGNEERQTWSYRPNLERIGRTSLTILRREIRPVPIAHYASFLMEWQHVRMDRRRTTAALDDVLQQMLGLPLPAEVWDRDILPGRAHAYSTDQITSITASGLIVWGGSQGGRIAVVRRGEAAAFLGQRNPEDSPASATGGLILEYLRAHGASFLSDIRSETNLSLRSLNRGTAELFWSGLVTNDRFPEIVSIRPFQRSREEDPERIHILAPRHNHRRVELLRNARRALSNTPGWEGRWSLLDSPAVMGPPMSLEKRAEMQARQLLDRYGVVARELVQREPFLPWRFLAKEFQRLELRGEIRRGYFVEGLSGMQFAHRAAAAMIRGSGDSPTQSGAVLLNACDPANPFGPGIPGPFASRFSRHPASYILLLNGEPVLSIEQFGTRVWTVGGLSDEVFIECLRRFTSSGWPNRQARPFNEIHLQYLDGERPGGNRRGQLLRSIGFYGDRDQTMRWFDYS